MPLGSGDRVLVVGAGPAGLSAAEELRRRGFSGELTVLGAEPVGPYHRPACSKELLTGHQTPAGVALPLPVDLAAHWRLGQTAVRLDPVSRRVFTGSGETLRYDGLVLATGARAALPAGWPVGWPVGRPGIHALHGLADAWAVRRELRSAQQVAVIGGGLTGCEVACSIHALARRIVLVDPHPRLMDRTLGAPVSALVTDVFRGAGIDLRLGHRVREVTWWRGRWRLLLDDGKDLHVDLVVVTTGERPETGWLAGSGLDVADGVRCDEYLHAVGAQGITVAGSLARWPNGRLNDAPVRCGHWISAMEQGRAAARTLLAGRGAGAPVRLLPRFWSYQLGLRIQVCGRIDPDADVCLTDPRPGRRLAARAGVLSRYYRNGRLVGLVAVNAPQEFAPAARTLLASTGAPSGQLD